MELEVGSIVEGKVTGITKFGAFVTLPDGKSGLVHISEVANAFVADIAEYVQLGQSIRVRVLGVSPEGKINFSIKRAVEQAPAAPRENSFRRAPAPRRDPAPRPEQPAAADPPSADQSFEDKLKKFMQESDSRIADNRIYAEHNRRTRRH